MLVSLIKADDPRAELIDMADVLIWDEAPMANKAVLACVEEACRLATHSDLPFGGKIVILLGDFRQTCPVIKSGSKSQIIDACIKSSPLWSLFQPATLTQLIRNAEDPAFAAFVNDIGDGRQTEVPFEGLHTTESQDDILNFVFPPDLLLDPIQSSHRAILAPTNAQIDDYNNRIIGQLPGRSRTYIAADVLKEVNDAGLVPVTSELDYVTRHTPPGLPHHTLVIKVGGVYRLMRNLSIDRGLVKHIPMLHSTV